MREDRAVRMSLRALPGLLSQGITRYLRVVREPGSAAEGVSILTALQTVRLVLRFLAMALVFRYFGPEQKGLIDIAMAAYGLMTLLQFQTGQLVQTAVPEYEARGLRWSMRAILWQAYGLDAVSQLVLTGAALGLAGAVATFYDLGELRSLVIAAAVGNLWTVFRGPVNRSALIALREYRRSGFIDFIQILAETGVALFVVFGRGSAVRYVFLLSAAPAVSAVYGWWVYARHLTVRLRADQRADEPGGLELLRSSFRFAGVVSVNSALNGIYWRIGPLVAGRYFSPATVGLYTLSSGIVALLWSIVALPESIILPTMSKASARGRAALSQAMHKGWRSMFAYAGLASALLLAFAPEIVLVVGGGAFAGAAPILTIFAIFPIFNAPDTVRNLFYVRRTPSVTLGRFAAIVAGELATYFPLMALVGIRGLAVSRVGWRAAFALLITFAAARALENADWRRSFGAIWTIVGWGATFLLLEFLGLALVRTLLPDASLIVSIPVRALVALGCGLGIVWRSRILQEWLSGADSVEAGDAEDERGHPSRHLDLRVSGAEEGGGPAVMG